MWKRIERKIWYVDDQLMQRDHINDSCAIAYIHGNNILLFAVPGIAYCQAAAAAAAAASASAFF